MERSMVPAVLSGSGVSSGPDETHEIGRQIGVIAAPGTVLALIGPLGAGKTQLTKGIAAGLGVTEVVNSPTFILMNEHVGRLRLYHVDAYRLGGAEEAWGAGILDERQVDGVTVVEWADLLEGWLPLERLEIHLVAPASAPMRRELHWTAIGSAHERLAAAAFGAQ
ncbi:MAG: tRNA (adenosine(37)-N6)-threonylcarbamoyltransferase complex ATPase subunit type 1 TsaE [Candidatus Limnocylindria bacterium]|jgi:tRNA threonylcarbamoyladenosine biosynthesis protein TsaE